MKNDILYAWYYWKLTGKKKRFTEAVIAYESFWKLSQHERLIDERRSSESGGATDF
jgi:hypothetical protein